MLRASDLLHSMNLEMTCALHHVITFSSKAILLNSQVKEIKQKIKDVYEVDGCRVVSIIGGTLE